MAGGCCGATKLLRPFGVRRSPPIVVLLCAQATRPIRPDQPDRQGKGGACKAAQGRRGVYVDLPANKWLLSSRYLSASRRREKLLLEFESGRQVDNELVSDAETMRRDGRLSASTTTSCSVVSCELQLSKKPSPKQVQRLPLEIACVLCCLESETRSAVLFGSSSRKK